MTTTPLMQSRLPRRHFLARCAVCMSAGFVPSILFARQQPPLSPSPGAPDLVDDLVAAIGFSRKKELSILMDTSVHGTRVRRTGFSSRDPLRRSS